MVEPTIIEIKAAIHPFLLKKHFNLQELTNLMSIAATVEGKQVSEQNMYRLFDSLVEIQHKAETSSLFSFIDHALHLICQKYNITSVERHEEVLGTIQKKVTIIDVIVTKSQN